MYLSILRDFFSYITTNTKKYTNYFKFVVVVLTYALPVSRYVDNDNRIAVSLSLIHI